MDRQTVTAKMSHEFHFKQLAAKIALEERKLSLAICEMEMKKVRYCYTDVCEFTSVTN